MKHANLYTSLILSLFCTTAFALEGSDCLKQSERLPEAKRQSFMETCLNKVQSPANTKELERKHKSAACAQNAKNKGLSGSSKSQYESECMNKNEAAIAAKQKPDNKVDLNNLGGDSKEVSKPRKDKRAKTKKQKPNTNK